MRNNTRRSATLAGLLLLTAGVSGVLAGAPGQTSVPQTCRPGWYNPPYEHCPPRPSPTPTPTGSPTPRPTPRVIGVGVVPGPASTTAPVLLPDTSTE